MKGTVKENNMKNILAENMLRFGVKNLSGIDRKKIKEVMIREQRDDIALPAGSSPATNIRDVDLASKYSKQIAAQLLKRKENDLTPFVIGNQYIFVPQRHDNQEQKGVIVTFEKGYYSLPALTPLSENGGTYGSRSYDSIDYAFVRRGVFTGTKSAPAKNFAEYLNKMFGALPNNLIDAIYNGNPSKAEFDAAIQNARNQISKTPANELSNLKTIAATLTGNAKEFYNLIPQTAAPTTQPTPQKQ